MDIIGKVKEWEDAYKLEGKDPATSLPFAEPKNAEERALNAMQKTWTIIRALNEGKKPDWNDWKQKKWELWWNMDGNPAVGSGFSLVAVFYDYSFTLVGSRLVFLDEKVARYFAKQFGHIVREWMVILPD